LEVGVKTKLWSVASVLAGLVIVGDAGRVDAQGVPGTLSFSARLQADGALSNESHDLVFKIFDVAAGGAPLWSESAPDTKVEGGVVSQLLGATTPMTPAVFDGGARWLEISVDGTILEPRLAIASVPYAMRAAVASRVEGQLGASRSVLESFAVNARSDCGTVAPAPRMKVYVNREPVGAEIEVVPSSFAAYEVRLPKPTYVSEIAVAFVNDNNEGDCDHNLHVQSIVLADGTVLPADQGENVIYDTGNPFDGLDVLPGTTTVGQNGALRFLLAPQVMRTTTSTFVGNFNDYRANDGTCAVNTWCDVPRRALSVKKQIDGSLLKITYTDTLGSYATQYQACNWRILVDDAVAAYFSDADHTRASGVAWTMSHGSHVALAPGVASGERVIKVQVLRQPSAAECLMGWNTQGGGPQASGHLLVEEVP
jgi:hypothetical protein